MSVAWMLLYNAGIIFEGPYPIFLQEAKYTFYHKDPLINDSAHPNSVIYKIYN